MAHIGFEKNSEWDAEDKKSIHFSYCSVSIDHTGAVMEHFMDYLLELEDRLFLSRFHYPIHMSRGQCEAVDKATQCWLCSDTVPAADRALDHDQ